MGVSLCERLQRSALGRWQSRPKLKVVLLLAQRFSSGM